METNIKISDELLKKIINKEVRGLEIKEIEEEEKSEEEKIKDKENVEKQIEIFNKNEANFKGNTNK